MKKTTKKIMKGIQIASVAGLATFMVCDNVYPVVAVQEEMAGRTLESLPAEAQELVRAGKITVEELDARLNAGETVADIIQLLTPKVETPSEDKETPIEGEETPTEEEETPAEGEETPTEEEETPAEGEETPTEEEETPTEGEETPSDEIPEQEIEISQPKEDAEVEPSTNNGDTITDTSAEAVYTQRSYNPSEAFISRSEKITYNQAIPIEGLPGFITQEMIVGALKCQDETGFPASVTIAQIIQESGFGSYGQGGESGQGLSYLAYQYCNLFGIKGTGTAGSVNMSTGEQTSSGENYTITAGFRVYHTYTECIEDRTQLLQRVYSDLTDGVIDANTFAMKIGGRWATSITYGESLIHQMEYYDLYRLDEMTLADFSDMIGTFTNPCPGATLTSDFGYRTYDNSFHKGIDLGTGSENIPTYAAAAGTVVEAGWSDSAGNWIVIDHGNGLTTKYMHHSEIYVEKGQEVTKGQQIGLSGTTGDSSGNHLHFQVEENKVAVDPEPYLKNANTDTIKMTKTSSINKNVLLDEKIVSNLSARLRKKNLL